MLIDTVHLQIYNWLDANKFEFWQFCFYFDFRKYQCDYATDIQLILMCTFNLRWRISKLMLHKKNTSMCSLIFFFFIFSVFVWKIGLRFGKWIMLNAVKSETDREKERKQKLRDKSINEVIKWRLLRKKIWPK